MKETLGERLKRLREGAGLSQSELEAAAKIPIGTLRNWEQDRRIPRLDVAAVIARTLKVSLDELAGDVLPKKPRGQAKKGRVT